MKILRVCPRPLYTDRVYGRYPKPHRFNQAIELLRATNLLLPGGWKEAMEEWGHEVFETVFDDHFLQGLWASENNALSALSSPSPGLALLARQIESFKPDVVFLYAGAMYKLDHKERAHLRGLCGQPFKLVGYWGDEVPPAIKVRDFFANLDFLFVSNESYKACFEAHGVGSVVAGNAFDQKFAVRTAGEPDSGTPLFAGDTGYLAADHIHRYETLDRLLEETDVEIRTYRRPPLLKRRSYTNLLLRGVQLLVPDAVIKAAAHICYRYFPERDRIMKALSLIREANAAKANVSDMMPKAHPLASYFADKPPLEEKYSGRLQSTPIDYSDYLHLLSSHLLCINIHRDEEHDYGNIRCFEVTGMGSLLFSDNTKRMGEFFKESEEYVGFENAGELITKLAYYKKHTGEAKKIALAGQRKTFANYTVKHRCKIVHDTLTGLFFKQAA